MVLRVIDLETTGTDPENDEIIEIGSVALSRDGEISDIKENLCRPSIKIPPDASAIHHIVDDDLIDAAPVSEAIREHADADMYAAHNASFEMGFLRPLLGEVKMLCTYRIGLRLYPDLPRHSNQFLRYHFGFVEPFGWTRDRLPTHRALGDAIVTARILVQELEDAKTAGIGLAQLLAWSSEPPLMSIFGFGKHKGQKFADVPADYLTWIIDKSEMDEGAKFSAQYWLNKSKG